MRQILRASRWPVLVVLFSALTSAQTKKPEVKPGTAIGVTIVTQGTRLRNIGTALRERVAGDINRKFKGIRAIPLRGPDDVALDQARNEGCRYVLRLKVIAGAAVTISSAGTVAPGVGYPGSHVAEKITVAYRVLPLDGTDPVVDDEMPIFEEDPGPTAGGMPPRRSTWDMDQRAYERMVSSGTSGAAQAAIKKFRKKTGL